MSRGSNWVDDAMSLSKEELIDELQRPCDDWNKTIERVALIRLLQKPDSHKTNKKTKNIVSAEKNGTEQVSCRLNKEYK